MTGRAPLRWLVWLALLAGLGWLVATDKRGAPATDVAQLPARKPAATVPAPAVPTAMDRIPAVDVRDPIPRAQLIPRRNATSTAPDLFASRNWAPPPPPAAPAPPAILAPPPAPPPAFTYLGKRRDEQGWQVYLGRGELALIVREGDAVEGGYRVESIKPPTLTLVRADGKQQIAIGEWE